MTDETTRIPVPTNGHEPMPTEGGVRPGAGDGAASGVPGVGGRPDLRIAVTPAQAATGFAVIAGLIGIVLGLRRRRGR